MQNLEMRLSTIAILTQSAKRTAAYTQGKGEGSTRTLHYHTSSEEIGSTMQAQARVVVLHAAPTKYNPGRRTAMIEED